MKKYKNFYYELFIGVLSLLSAIIIIIQSTMNIEYDLNNKLNLIEIIIWIIFFSDYIIRLINSKKKIEFIKHNKIDLVSIIPFNSVFQSLRLFRSLEILRLSKLTRITAFATLIFKFKNKILKYAKSNNFIYLILLTAIILISGAGAISIVEKKPFFDSIWFSIVTVATVGYGEIVPVTNSGKIISIILMLVGIGFMGALTGRMSAYFIEQSKKPKTYKEGLLDEVQNKLENFDDLTNEDLENIYNVLKSLKKKS